MNAYFSKTSLACGFLMRLPAASPTELSFTGYCDRPPLGGVIESETAAEPESRDRTQALSIE